MSSNQADIENALNEKTPLLVKTEKININSDYSSPTQNIPNGNTNIQTQSTTGRLVSFGAYSVLIAVHMIGNGYILSTLGPAEEAAAGLIATLQGVINGTTFGVLLSTGIELGSAIGKKEADKSQDKSIHDQKIGAIIKTSWFVGMSMSVLAGSFYLITPVVMPKIVAVPTGRAVGEFLSAFAFGAFAEPMLGNNGIIIAQVEKNMILPFLSMAGYRLPALGLSYFFAKNLKLGATGVGLGGTCSAIASMIFTQMLFSREAYKNLRLHNFIIPNFYNNLKTFLDGGWRLALQRLTEWGNLAAITTIIGAWNNDKLQALNPAIQANTLIGFVMQGMGQAAMMFLVQDCKVKSEYYKRFTQSLSSEALQQYSQLISTNRQAFLKNNIAGLLLTAGLSGATYLARKPIIELFLGSNIATAQYQLAEYFMLYTLLGLLPDSLRIISGGILRGWGDLLYPTLMSLLFMTVLGVPAGAGIAYAFGENALIFLWIRFIAIAISAAFNFYRFYGHVNADHKLYLEGQDILDINNALLKWESCSNMDVTSQNKLMDMVKNTGLQKVTYESTKNGLFSAVAHQLESDNTADSLRILVAEEISNNVEEIARRENYNKSDFINALGNPLHDLTHNISLEILSSKLKINIVVIRNDGQKVNQFKSNDANKTIYLAYNVGREYSLLEGVPNARCEEYINYQSNFINNNRSIMVKCDATQAPRFGSLFYKKALSENSKIIYNQQNQESASQNKSHARLTI